MFPLARFNPFSHEHHHDHQIVWQVEIGHREECAANRVTDEADLYHGAELACPLGFNEAARMFAQLPCGVVSTEPDHQIKEKSDKAMIAKNLEVNAVRGPDFGFEHAIHLKEDGVLVAHAAAEYIVLGDLDRN